MFTMKMVPIFLLLCVAIGLGAAAHVDLQAKYPFSVVLFDEQGQYYELHWNFTRSSESIYFAVNVSTTGWIGFGLSPNGQMPGSDVVIGWVSNGGESYFHDRFAEGRFLPSVDTVSQDWFLINSEEEDGFTILEFSRNFTSCDPQDLDVLASTSRVVWSFSVSDPTDPSGSGARQHDYQGSRSLNLLGGLSTGNREVSQDELFLDFSVSNVEIPPNSTTYWCQFTKLPEEVVSTTVFINRMVPVISPHARSFVHHMVVYLCSEPLTEEEVGLSEPCDEISVALTLNCRLGTTLWAWAVGGEDFVYPEGVAYPIGGAGRQHYTVLEMHYDNPDETTGILDSSGLRFYYKSEEPEHRAGVLFLGHGIVPEMLIPPRSQDYTIAGICSATCTESYIPEDGIRLFANFLHTHLIGHGLTLEHYRPNPMTNELEELEPIDQNPNYDFDYQQTTYLARERVILPGDTLVLKCYYNSMDRNTITFGGLPTELEMCLSFVQYYPSAPDGSSLVRCVSFPTLLSSFTSFISELQSTGIGENLASNSSREDFLSVLDNVEWNSDLVKSLQEDVLGSEATGFCDAWNGGDMYDSAVTLPTMYRPFQPQDRCAIPSSARTNKILASAIFFFIVLAAIV